MAPLAALIAQYEIEDQVNIIAFEAVQAQRLKAAYPALSVGYLTSSISLNEDEPLLALEKILDVVQKYDTTFNPSYASGALGTNVMTAAAHRGVTIWPWTVNKQGDFDTYFLYGTNGITTNHSYYVSDYLKNVTTAEKSYSVEVGVETSIPVITTTYDRDTKEVTTGSMVVISGNPDHISYKKGQLTVTEAGEYTVFFRHASRLSNGKIYYMCSQPVTITAGADVIVPDAEQMEPSVELTPTEKNIISPIAIVAIAGAVVLLGGGITVLALKKW